MTFIETLIKFFEAAILRLTQYLVAIIYSTSNNLKNKVAIQFRGRTAITNLFQCETAFDFCDHSLYLIQREHLRRHNACLQRKHDMLLVLHVHPAS